MRTCKVCGKTKEMEEFYNNKSYSCGKSSKCKECAKKLTKEWARDHKDYCREQVRIHCKKYPQKRNAYSAIGYAKRNGIITKPDKCSNCGESGMIHAHHWDYSKPLDVIWLCSACHANIHHLSKASSEQIREML